jgi:uncharacterized protein (DUF4415 family)
MRKSSTKKAGNRVVDEDNPPWTKADFARAVPFSGLPSDLQRVLSNRPRGLQKEPKKVAVSIRLSPDVVKAFRASGAGWQTRVDEILRAHIK